MKKIKRLADFLIYRLYLQGEGIIDIRYELLKFGVRVSDEQFKLLAKILDDSELVHIQTGKYSKRIRLHSEYKEFPTEDSFSEPGKAIVEIFKNEFILKL